MNILDELIDRQGERLLNSPVLNSNPTIKMPYKIAVIGDVPSRDDELLGRPFCGQAGKALTTLFTKVNLIREACFLGNISSPTLAEDLAKFNPNICLLLGKSTLHSARGDEGSLDAWRGSLFLGTQGAFLNRKCVASYHPREAIRNYEWLPILLFDLQKAKTESLSPDFNLPIRNIEINLTSHEIITRLEKISSEKTKIALDIEGVVDAWSCISIATSPVDVFIIPFVKFNGDSYWSIDEECLILKALANVLADVTIGKILQNSLYDRFVLQYSYNLIILGTVDDTMLKSWELYCELEKGLGFMCSIYTREPYYKSDRKSDDREIFWKYCCKDSAVTYEISNELDKRLTPAQRKHYEFNIGLLNMLLYMELRGILYDTPLAKSRLSEVNTHIYNLQYKLDIIAGVGFSKVTSKEELLKQVQKSLCYVRNCNQPYKGMEAAYARCLEILSKSTLESVDIGELDVLAEQSMNIKSNKFKTFLYETLKLPKQIKRDPETGKEHLCTDYESLLKIKKKQPHEAVDLGIYIGELRSRSQMLEIYADGDGRIRCGLNVVGQVTGRISSYTSPTGSGYNLTTIPDNWPYPQGHPLRQGMRDLFISDPDYDFFQCDLKGADGWTIGAHLAALGNSNMIDDLRYGIKPAARIAYMLRHGNASLMHKKRDEVKELLKEIKKEDWDYFACKVGIWGICYLMGPVLLGNQIMEESQGSVIMSTAQLTDFRNAVFSAYQVQLWHQHCQRYIDRTGQPILQSASGNIRKFFGRKQSMLGDYLAHEPQNNTTYALKLAMQRLWQDKENRDGNWLRIQPFLPVHDALLGQFHKSQRDWAITRIKTYFDNEITIAGQKIIIPFEGNFGTAWGNLKEPI